MSAAHVHELVICRCDTVVRDCGCRLRPVLVVRNACWACSAALERLTAEGRSLCGAAYEPEVGLD